MKTKASAEKHFGMTTQRIQPKFFLSRHAELTASKPEIRRLHSSGTLTRLCSGVYVNTTQWKSLKYDDPYRFRVMASAQRFPRSTQYSHDSAAVMWGLPSLGAWSPNVHALVARASGGRSTAGLKRHGVGEEAGYFHIDDMRVTSLLRTLIDVSCTSSFLRGVGMIDAGLHALEIGGLRHQLGAEAATRAELLELLDSLLPRAGSAKAREAIEFGDGLSGSLLESLSRGQFHLLGMPPPELQVPFFDEEGYIGDVDFYWRELDLIGECDGKFKYAGNVSPSGRPGLEVLLAEKAREDRLRRVVRGFVRWDWDVAMSRERLATRVRPFGLVGRRG